MCFLRWSIILPVNWIKAFWISMVSHGAHAIGLQERRWIACEATVMHVDIMELWAGSNKIALLIAVGLPATVMHVDIMELWAGSNIIALLIAVGLPVVHNSLCKLDQGILDFYERLAAMDQRMDVPHVQGTLLFSFHRRVDRQEVGDQVQTIQRTECKLRVLHDLGRLDFNMVQSIRQRQLREFSGYAFSFSSVTDVKNSHTTCFNFYKIQNS
ncbi:hypothetical protein EJ110_NYTH57707 [Nymphaea thermarum]|nr:hypothetical protein EJ110_NYTH57707 [Nymphaea thermarum]